MIIPQDQRVADANGNITKHYLHLLSEMARKIAELERRIKELEAR